MRSAILRGFRPTTLTNRRQPYSKWDKFDFLLLEAFDVMESETSKSTGLPVWLTRSGDPMIDFLVEDGEDFADAAIQKYDKAQKGPKGDKEPPPGSFRYAIPQTLDGSAVPEGGLARERMLKATGERMAIGRGALPGSDLQIQRQRPAGGYDTSQYG